MNLTRRDFGASLGMGLLAGTAGVSGFVLGGCDVWSEAEQWVPVGITAFEQVVTLVAPFAAPGINTIADLVSKGFAVLASSIDQYRNAPADQKATKLQQVLLAFETLSSNLQNFLNAINVPSTNPIVKIVLGLVNILLSTIMGFVNRITTTSATTSRRLTLAGQSVNVTPVLRDRKKFVSDWNAEATADGHPEAVLN